MASRPRAGYTVLNQEVHLHVPFRYLPIIIVPGNMGTRLTDPRSNELVWNPVGAPIGDSPGPFTVNYQRLSQMSAELVPDETHQFDDPHKNEGFKGIKHYFNLVPDFYDDTVLGLAGLSLLHASGSQLRPKVYCCGYDWRQDTARSALRLAEVVEEALAETRERKVIIVAHSLGGHVARYYCRVLGGESRVHQLFLVGSPTLGAPSAYMQLKNGVTGLYLKDLKDDWKGGDAGDALGGTVELIQSSARVLSTVGVAVTGAGFKASALSFFGAVYGALCLGAGRLLSRKETTYFVRQLTSVYQLMPGALYCRDHKRWLLFDPMATGYAPTGKMVVLPTLVDGGLKVLEEVKGTAAKEKVQQFLTAEASEERSGRTTRNVVTLKQAIKSVEDAIKSVDAHDTKSLDKKKQAQAKMKQALPLLKEIFDRAKQTFVDARNPRQVYDDIYTGLLDVVALRPLVAANLALFYRFDQALTVRPREEKGKSGVDLVMAPLDRPLKAVKRWMTVPGNAVAAFGEEVWGWVWDGDQFDLPKRFQERQARTRKSQEQERQRAAAAAVEREKNKPRAYMHPRTVNIYCKSFLVENGCSLLPLAVHSNDDSNFVTWAMVPSYVSSIVLLAQEPGSSEPERAVWGDGTVPHASANPEREAISCDVLEAKEVSKVEHNDLLKHVEVVIYLKQKMQELVPSFYET